MKYFNLNWLLLFLIYTNPASSKNSYQIDYLEPPFWWTGMENNTLQLMVHGKNIGDLEPELSYPGVEINGVHRLENPNYLFIDLLLSKTTMPRINWPFIWNMPWICHSPTRNTIIENSRPDFIYIYICCPSKIRIPSLIRLTV